MVRREERLVPFSMGKRRCPGEGFAKANLFLFFIGLLQEFSLKPSVAGRPPSEDYRLGLSLCPEEFTVRLMPRTESIAGKQA